MLNTIRFTPVAGFILGAALLATSPAAAQDATGGNSQDESTGTELRRDPDRRICVREQLTGSRLRQTICKTQREWDAEAGGPGRD